MDEGQRRSLGAVIRTLREAGGLSRQELVERTSPNPSERVSLEMLAKVEQGKKAPSASTLRKLAAALGLEPTDLASTAAWWEHKEFEGAAASLLRLGVTQALAVGRQLQGGAGRPLFAGAGGMAAALPIIGAGAAGAVAAALGFSAVNREFKDRESLAAWLRQQAALVTEGSEQDVEEVTQALGLVLHDPPTSSVPEERADNGETA